MWGWVLTGNIFSKHWLSFLIICNKGRTPRIARSEVSTLAGDWEKKEEDVPALVKEKYFQ